MLKKLTQYIFHKKQIKLKKKRKSSLHAMVRYISLLEPEPSVLDPSQLYFPIKWCFMMVSKYTVYLHSLQEVKE